MELLKLTGNIHFLEMLNFIGRKLMTEHEKIYLTAESLCGILSCWLNRY
ncbi:MAG: hypothetical protein CM1200mP41_11730 [Gammaproteobacteria bacterium]|nr:MAG: hypothetical protein CM1200mP41_11730 [Gammaproteobacteria bacterium]